MIQKYKTILPSLILFGYAVYACLLSNYVVGSRNYAGFIASVICLITFFIEKELYKTIVFSTLVLGSLNILIFTGGEHYFTLTMFGLEIQIQFFSSSILGIAVFLFNPKKEDINDVDPKQIEQFKQKQYEEDLEKFKIKFENKSSIDLKEILNSERYTQAAKDAAQFVIISRENEAKG